MKALKFELVALADAMKLGAQLLYSPVHILFAFYDRIALDGTPHETPEHAFLASLIGGTAGHYTLHENHRGYGYILSRIAQPSWQAA